MQLRLLVVVVVAVAVCDGRATSLSKSPDASQQSPSSGSQASPSGGGQVAASSGTFAPTGPEMNYTFDPCFGKACLKYVDITHTYLTYFKRHIGAARWIKGKKKPFDPSLSDAGHLKELNAYRTKDATMQWASPAVMMFEAPAHEFSQIKAVINNHRASIRNAFAEAKRASDARDRPAYAAAMNEFDRLQNIGDPLLLEAAKNYSKTVSVTITNYLHEKYQKNLSDPTAPLIDPPAPTNPDFTIMTQPEMKVFIRGFGGNVEGCFKALFELTLFINREDITTFYCANYANGILEAWVPINPNEKFFV